MTGITVLFWIALAVVFYTYLGYGIILRAAVWVRERWFPRREPQASTRELPEVSLLIAAWNEEEIVDEKMRNCLNQTYPADRLHIVWVTDGSDDGTCERLAAWRQAEVLHAPGRRGKTAALNRAIPLLKTSIVICTDANTMLCPEAVARIVHLMADPKVGCVAGEKRVVAEGCDPAASTEGVYWRYESKLKEWDDRLSTAVGAAGELFALRRELFEPLPEDTLLDDFMLSMNIARRGYRIAYCSGAYAVERPSADLAQEAKRKRRIAAGGLQSVWRLRALLNPFRYGSLCWQYVSHRVLRWTITPLLLFALLPLNAALVAGSSCRLFYGMLFVGQMAFYAMAAIGYAASLRDRKAGIATVFYYFLFMNMQVFAGISYLCSHKGTGAWEKARRA